MSVIPMLMAGDFNGGGKDLNGTNKIAIWIKAIAIIGIPGIIALFLVWTGANSLPAIEREVLLNRQETQRNRELLDQQLQRLDRLYWLMQATCSNGARTPQDRSLCFPDQRFQAK